MKKILLLTFLLGSFVAALAHESLLVATYNIRYKNVEDVGTGNGWEKRREHVRRLIHFHGFDIVGLQEVMPDQLPDFRADLPDYDYVGTLNNDGKAHGAEYVPVFYRRDRFELLDSGTFWFSSTPEVSSRGWDALYPRICTWVKLRDRRTDRVVQFWNTHLDHRGAEARKKSAELFVERIKPVLDRKETLVLVGDFNFRPESETYSILTKVMKDARAESATLPYGPVGTTNWFNYTGDFTNCIDYIFVSKGISVLKHGTLTDSYEHRFPSDHFPVMAQLILP